MITFPRTDWTGVRLGFPPYAPGDVHELAYAARKASRAWARAVATADWRAVDRACFQLCVYDKASELNDRYQADRGRTPIAQRPVMTYQDWVGDMHELVEALYELACSGLPAGSSPPTLEEVKPFIMSALKLRAQATTVLDDEVPPSPFPEMEELGRFASAYQRHIILEVSEDAEGRVTTRRHFVEAQPFPQRFLHTRPLPDTEAMQ